MKEEHESTEEPKDELNVKHPPEVHPVSGSRQRLEETKKKLSYKTYELFLYIYGAIAFLLVSRFAFSLVGARHLAPFVEFVYGLSTPLMIPFRDMFTVVQSGPYRIEFEVLVALLVYALLFYGVGRLIQIVFD